MQVDIDGRVFRIRFRYDYITSEQLPPWCQVSKSPAGSQWKRTTCYVEDTDGQLWKGFSICSSGDQFQKEIGRKHALRRAIKSFSRHLRTAIWEEYRKIHRRVTLAEQVAALQQELAEARGVLRDHGCECSVCQK